MPDLFEGHAILMSSVHKAVMNEGPGTAPTKALCSQEAGQLKYERSKPWISRTVTGRSHRIRIVDSKFGEPLT
jgi:hypothetical protein